ncbi:hypothetical protein [Thalassospira sp.]|uniref:hypothetical protein n=1 Tax=Thalassospira sp. TaxID=1912094 RepID=UPI0032EF6FF0
MSSSIKRSFDHSSGAVKPKRPAPFSIRLSGDERAVLKRRAGNKPLGAYVRAKLLGDEETRRKPSRAPSIDYALLGQVLGMLGKSEQVRCLFLLAVAAKADRLELKDEDLTALNEACEDIHDMRGMLVKALGLKAGNVK